MMEEVALRMSSSTLGIQLLFLEILLGPVKFLTIVFILLFFLFLMDLLCLEEWKKMIWQRPGDHPKIIVGAVVNVVYHINALKTELS